MFPVNDTNELRGRSQITHQLSDTSTKDCRLVSAAPLIGNDFALYAARDTIGRRIVCASVRVCHLSGPRSATREKGFVGQLPGPGHGSNGMTPICQIQRVDPRLSSAQNADYPVTSGSTDSVHATFSDRDKHNWWYSLVLASLIQASPRHIHTPAAVDGRQAPARLLDPGGPGTTFMANTGEKQNWASGDGFHEQAEHARTCDCFGHRFCMAGCSNSCQSDEIPCVCPNFENLDLYSEVCWCSGRSSNSCFPHTAGAALHGRQCATVPPSARHATSGDHSNRCTLGVTGP